jgi:hypothetical protein
MKKKTKRDKVKYKALEPELNLKTRYEEIEDVASYAKKIPDKLMDVTLADGTTVKMNPKEWLNSFMEETVCANFNHKGVKVIKDKQGELECYRRNNQRNRCVYTKQKAQGDHNMDYLEDMKKKEFEITENNDEDSTIMSEVVELFDKIDTD